MSIKRSESMQGLITKLKDRNLNLDETITLEYLKKYNYFNVINGFETLLLPEPKKKPKKYDTETFDDFVALFEFDKNFTSLVLSRLNELESQLKTSISHHFSNINCSELNKTMEYTNKRNYMDPCELDPTQSTYCRYHDQYPFKNFQNKKICSEFENFILFRPFFLSNLIDRNDFIDKSFYTDTNYTASNTVCRYRDQNRVVDDHVAVPMWVAIETLTFGELIRILHYLKDDVLELVMNDVSLRLSKRNQFLNMLDILVFLRNSCAHGSLINRFRTPSYIKLNSDIVTSFELTPKENGTPESVLKLFDTLKILGFFTDLSVLKKPLKKIIYRNNKEFKKKTYDLNERLLERMGNSSYQSWKKMLTNNNYTV